MELDRPAISVCSLPPCGGRAIACGNFGFESCVRERGWIPKLRARPDFDSDVAPVRRKLATCDCPACKGEVGREAAGWGSIVVPMTPTPTLPLSGGGSAPCSRKRQRHQPDERADATRRLFSPLRRRGEIAAAAAGDELALRIEHVRLRGRDLAAHAHDLAAHGKIARHGGGVVIDAQIDGGHAAAGLLDHGPVGADIDERGQNTAMAVAALGIDYPLLAPSRLELDAVLVK